MDVHLVGIIYTLPLANRHGHFGKATRSRHGESQSPVPVAWYIPLSATRSTKISPATTQLDGGLRCPARPAPLSPTHPTHLAASRGNIYPACQTPVRKGPGSSVGSAQVPELGESPEGPGGGILQAKSERPSTIGVCARFSCQMSKPVYHPFIVFLEIRTTSQVKGHTWSIIRTGLFTFA